jgi:hypothetical protein
MTDKAPNKDINKIPSPKTFREELNLNSVNQLIFVMVKCGVLFEVWTEFLNII